jgi:S1-C subfamily serine protease
MSERVSAKSHGKARILAAITVASLLGSGCNLVETGELNHPNAPRCFDKPLPATAPYSLEATAKPLTLSVSDGNIVKGDPVALDPTVEAKVRRGVVKVVNEEGSGSGAVVAKNGKQFVITASHVAATKGLKAIDDDGDKISLKPLCYIWEDKGAFVDRKSIHDGVADRDITILKVADSAGSAALAAFNPEPLQISKKPAARGDWLTFMNYQHFATTPEIYTGVVATAPPTGSFRVLAGVNPYRLHVTDTQIGAGASGGAAVNAKGELVGTTDSSLKDGLYMGSDEIKSIYNITFQHKLGQGLNPADGTGETAAEVAQALASVRVG